jgi:hypothetical protein
MAHLSVFACARFLDLARVEPDTFSGLMSPCRTLNEHRRMLTEFQRIAERKHPGSAATTPGGKNHHG